MALGPDNSSLVQDAEQGVAEQFGRGSLATAVNESSDQPAPGPPKNWNGRDALLRVREGKPKADAEHRVPTNLQRKPQGQWPKALSGPIRVPA